VSPRSMGRTPMSIAPQRTGRTTIEPQRTRRTQRRTHQFLLVSSASSASSAVRILAAIVLGLGSLAPSTARAQFVSVIPRAREGDEPRLVLYRAENLVDARARARGGDKRLRSAYDALEREARDLMRAGPWSVMDKTRVAPSGDKHDYVSYAPYWWPDSTKPNGLPYIQRDGLVNPESRDDTDHDA